jgi:hypothetical protein
MKRSERAMIRRHKADQVAIEAGIEATIEALPWVRKPTSL